MKIIKYINSVKNNDYWVTVHNITNNNKSIEISFLVKLNLENSTKYKEYKCKLKCNNVLKYQICDFNGGGFSYIEDNSHPALLQFTDDKCQLIIENLEENLNNVIGILFNIHENVVGDWIEFTEYFNKNDILINILKSKSNILAEGPRFLIKKYFEALKNLKGDFKLQDIYIKKNINKTPKLIHFGDSYIIAEEIIEV